MTSGSDDNGYPGSVGRYRRDKILDLLKPIADMFKADVEVLVGVAAQTSQIMVALSRQNEIPCISYFCTLNSSQTPNSCRETLVHMVKSLIIQLVLMLPDHIVTSLDLSEERFRPLGEKSIAMYKTIRLLRDLISLARSYLHYIIGGIEAVEDRDDAQQSRDVMNVLDVLTDMHLTDVEEVDGKQQSPKVIKVCFTTDGFADALAILAGDDRIDGLEYTSEVASIDNEEGVRLESGWS